MKRRRGSTAEQELQSLFERRTQLAGDLERHEARRETARTHVHEARRLEAIELLDAPDSSTARRACVDAEAELQELTSNLDRLRLAIEEQDRRLEAKREEIRAEQIAEATAALQRGLAGLAKTSGTFAAALDQALVGHQALLSARANVKILRAKVSELGGDHFEHDVDEAPWPDARELVEYLTSDKPRRPIAEHERYERQKQADEEQKPAAERVRALDKTRAFAATSWDDPDEQERNRAAFFAQQVPDHCRDECMALYEQVRAELEAGPRRSLARI